VARPRWIVVGTDFSDGAAALIENAVRLAAKTQVSFACVHAYEDAPGTPLLDDRGSALAEALGAEHVRDLTVENEALEAELEASIVCPWAR
jgi:hypothetical protein